MAGNDLLVAPRKLTDDETSNLRTLLKAELNIAPGPMQKHAEEDAADLLDYAFAMIANGKNVGYVVKELKSMEMEVCDSESSQKLGRCLSNFLTNLSTDEDRDEDKAVEADITSNKEHGNALTNSGALGSSRTIFKTSPTKNNALTNSGALGASRIPERSKEGKNPPKYHVDGKDTSANVHESNHVNDSRNSVTSKNRLGTRGGDFRSTNAAPQPRSLHGIAFDRLRKQAGNQPRNIGSAQNQQINGNRGKDGPRGEHIEGGGRRQLQSNTGHGGGRADRWVRGGGRDPRGGRRPGGGDLFYENGRGRGNMNSRGKGAQTTQDHTQGGRFSGRRRTREEDFIGVRTDHGVYSDCVGNSAAGYEGRGRGARSGRVGRDTRGRGGREARGRGKDGRSGRANGEARLEISDGNVPYAKWARYQDRPSSIEQNEDGGYSKNPEAHPEHGADEIRQTNRDSHSHLDQSNPRTPGGQGRADPAFNNEGRGGRSWMRGGRKGGRGGRGRCSNTFYPNSPSLDKQQDGNASGAAAYKRVDNANATDEAAAVSESPLIAASFGHAVASSYRGRGRGQFGRGRGRGREGRNPFASGGRAGRAEVAEMILAKTWVRPRTMDEGLSARR